MVWCWVGSLGSNLHFSNTWVQGLQEALKACASPTGSENIGVQLLEAGLSWKS